MPFKNPHPLYAVWQGMRRRCRNPNFRQYADYGGRGISICDRWDSFQNFVDDMGARPDGYSLDRIDNDADYSPENCRWASRREQQRNQRRAVYVTIEGRKYRAIELAEAAGIKADTVISRAKRGMRYSDVISPQKHHDLSGLALGGKASGAKKRARTHCVNGHPLSGSNVHYTKEGWRKCRTCHLERERSRRKLRAR